jgi:hypothetical protein
MKRGSAGWVGSQIIQPQESLVLYKSFNTLWFALSSILTVCCTWWRRLDKPRVRRGWDLGQIWRPTLSHGYQAPACIIIVFITINSVFISHHKSCYNFFYHEFRLLCITVTSNENCTVKEYLTIPYP